MNEIWKTTTVNSDYEVSNMGNVRSNKTNKQRLLKPFSRGSAKKNNKKGHYLCVRLLTNGEEKDYAIHRLVAMAFIDNPNNLPQVNHKNGIKNDNRVDNLEWCDNSYNIWHSYNVLGNTNYKERKICQYTKKGEFIKEWESARDIEVSLGFSASAISSVCRKKDYRKTAYGFKWYYVDDDNHKVEYANTSHVVQISKYGEKIKVFDTIKDAALEVGVLDGGISGVCLKRKRGYNYAGGYLWRYVDDYDENEFGYFKDKTFIQMTMANIFVAEYKGTHELVDKSGSDLVKVIMCCRGQRNSTNGYKWCIKEEEVKTRNTKREKAVVQLDKGMNYIADYKSAVIAAKATNTHATHIGDSCKTFGKRTCGGYRWMYKDDYIHLIENK